VNGTQEPARVAIVGGGIAGLAAALRLRDLLGDRVAVTVLEQAGRAGGKLWTGELAGQRVERGAETFLMRDPQGQPSAAVRLVERLGLTDALVHPVGVPAAVAVGGELVPMPPGTLMGVPTGPGPVGAVALAEDHDRDSGAPVLGPDEDVAVGALVRSRFGDPVVDRLVEPLLGGVYAGRADGLSLAVTIPALARHARREHTLAGAVRAVLADRTPTQGPVFGALDGGLGRLVDALLAALPAGTVRTGVTVRELARTPTGWRLVTGPTIAREVVEADAVVLAVPAHPAARLLREVAPAAAAEVGVLDYASVGLVGLALPDLALPKLSGFLVPVTEGRSVKAMTNFTLKWGRDSAGVTLLRGSVGRAGETAALQRDDSELAELVHRELGELLGTALPVPLDWQVTRWGGGLPQYGPGHLDRVAQVRAAVPKGLTLAGAGYDGVGIPACVGSGEAAAMQLAGELAGR
jgi:protoporphyrinogen/coproporphyrinogen III oxidase